MIENLYRIDQDHVYMLISNPPQLSVSKALQYLKERVLINFFVRAKKLRKWCWWQHLWTRSYWIAMSGNVIDKV